MPFRVGRIGLSQVPISQHGRASRRHGALNLQIIGGSGLKDGGGRRILPEWVDDYVAMRAAEAEADWP